MVVVILDRQVADDIKDDNLPNEDELQLWLSAVLRSQSLAEKEVTVRFVSQQESAELNGTYRNKPKPTNVLSFPFEAPPGMTLPLLGDLVICQTIIEQEAKQQNKCLHHHYAHMVIHGCLHLLGFDHITNEEAEAMESLEITLLQQLGIDDPYQDD